MFQWQTRLNINWLITPQNGALRLKDHSKALVNAANLKGNVILSEQAELNLNNTTFSQLTSTVLQIAV